MPRVFLTASWRDLIIASYPLDLGLLTPRLPRGVELDLFRGQAMCSLVGFRFTGTRVLGVPWPGYRDFPEINLRFYVREEASGRRGVVFVRELVRSRFVALVARRLYNEPYVHAKINQRIKDREDGRLIEYRFASAGGEGRMRVEAEPDCEVPGEESPEHWFKEHQWGYGTDRRGRALRYEVQHPWWGCHTVKSWEIEVDWARIYGDEWAWMSDAQPQSVLLAVGSKIKVFGASRVPN